MQQFDTVWIHTRYTHPKHNQRGGGFCSQIWYAVQNSFRTLGNSYAAHISTAGKTHLGLVHNCGKAVRITLLPRKAVAAATVV